jgi:hypothetical protein
MIDALPTEPAAYWRPEYHLSEVYYLRLNGEWALDGQVIPPEAVPLDGLKLLGKYKGH